MCKKITLLKWQSSPNNIKKKRRKLINDNEADLQRVRKEYAERKATLEDSNQAVINHIKKEGQDNVNQLQKLNKQKIQNKK